MSETVNLEVAKALEKAGWPQGTAACPHDWYSPRRGEPESQPDQPTLAEMFAFDLGGVGVLRSLYRDGAGGYGALGWAGTPTPKYVHAANISPTDAAGLAIAAALGAAKEKP